MAVTDRRVKVKITLTLYDDGEVTVRCEGDEMLCSGYMKVVKMYTRFLSKMGGMQGETR